MHFPLKRKKLKLFAHYEAVESFVLKVYRQESDTKRNNVNAYYHIDPWKKF